MTPRSRRLKRLLPLAVVGALLALSGCIYAPYGGYGYGYGYHPYPAYGYYGRPYYRY